LGNPIEAAFRQLPVTAAPGGMPERNALMQRAISFTLNGKPVRLTVDEDRMLLPVLRNDLQLTGTKFGCGSAQCGACTVIVDKQAVKACVTPVKDVAGKHVLTIEGLGREGRLHPIQNAFLKHHAFQCGYCTSGMILNAYALLLKNPRPTRADIISHMDDNLCRCGSHLRIVSAIQEAARSMDTRGAAR
jgi:aerobic-type carbon monoxide dehydrogenase small subunit (CoxS/CutS family)